MLSPKRTKFRKQQRGRMRGVATRGNKIAFGQFALQAQECGWITSRQIEASRRAMTRYVKRGGQIWIRIFPDKPVTMRPAETRMGSGKGNPEFWVAVVKPGRVLFEMGGEEITESIAKEAMRLAQYKLPIKTKFICLAEGEKPTQIGKASSSSFNNEEEQISSTNDAEVSSSSSSVNTLEA